MNNPVFAELKNKFIAGSALIQLIVVNIVVFICVKLVKLIYFLMNLGDDSFRTLIKYFAVPADLISLLGKPWTLITYMFLHVDFMHILFNMFVLYLGGRIFSEYLGDKKFISTYFLGGISGAILYIIAFNAFPAFENILPNAIAMGASASVLAILVAAATFVPNYTVHLILIGPVKLKYIVIFLVLLDVISIESSNPGGHIAHLGGAIYGYIYISSLKKGFNVARWFENIADFFTRLFKPGSKLKVAYKKKLSDQDYNEVKIKKQEKMDDILDKISRSGYESLTKEEKEFLFKISKNL
ncbi:MAG: rhomboid family intramembrane serine protease [Bacteroidetes bacterium]|nr:rhomboid family intramembrane serine protease [Bacteroidota bacterium]HET6243377.1 rhomboid family intramembrane serine protease [Bacteroidia bacterium]